MKKLILALMVLAGVAGAQPVRYNPFTTNSTSFTGNTPASALLSFEGASLIASNHFTGGEDFACPVSLDSFVFVPNNSLWYFPGTNAIDQLIIFQGSPTGTGPGYASAMMMTNALAGYTPNLEGNYVWDLLANIIIATPWQTGILLLPGTDQWVGNGEPMVITTATSQGNKAHLWTTGNGPEGNQFLVPLIDGTTNCHPIATTFQTNGVTVQAFAQDAMKTAFWVNQDNGDVSINPGNVKPVTYKFSVQGDAGSYTLAYLGVTNSATTEYGAGMYLDSQSEGDNLWKMVSISKSDVSAAWPAQNARGDFGLWNGALGYVWTVDQGGNTSQGGVASMSGANITNTFNMADETNKVSGTFILNGSTTVNVGNTTVTSGCHIIITEQSANGGTQAGNPFVTGVTAGTGFAVKGTALDTSICFYIVTGAL